MAEVVDMAKRYELFAKVEAYFINEAFVIPYAIGGGGFVATRLEPFTPPYAPFGVSELKFKGQIVMQKPMDTDTYNAAFQKWEKDRAAALQKQGK
jgi:oligopeptide transport system substrate-binding protein